MALTAGTLSQVSVSSTSANVTATAATGGTGPYTEAYYISTTTGFTPPGAGTLVTGASGLAATLSGLIPLTQYFVKVIYTDTGNANATVTSTQLALATTVSVLSQNQFAQTNYIGVLDQRYNYNTTAVQIDVSQATPLFSGAAVKVVSGSTPGVPKVVGCTADTDEVYGFINWPLKDAMFVAGSTCEISQAGNVISLYATTAIATGQQVTLDITTMGGVGALVGSSGANIVGSAFSPATAAGQLLRVKLGCPSFKFA
jgi:hypothetical protein